MSVRPARGIDLLDHLRRGFAPCTLVTTLYPPNACDKVAGASMTAWTNSASSMHPGGLNVLMGDGSVRFIKDTIQTWPFSPVTGNPAGASQNGQGGVGQPAAAGRLAGALDPIRRRGRR